MSGLISVIVPVYKVEKYLEKCVQSVCSQTYSNLEIILVDDGSPDSCPAMCDDFALKDNRIKVIHKENGGLSDARNAGLDVATGDFIAFVDSDDWIESEMYEKMLAAIHEYEADLAICCVEKIRSDGIFTQDIKHTKVYSRQTALYELIVDKNANSFAWNKLYRKELFDGLRYPKDKIFEDTLFTYKIFEKVNRVVHLNEIFYHYLRRDDSILGTWPLKVQLDFAIAQQERCVNLKNSHPELFSLMIEQYMKNLSAVKKLAVASPYNELKEQKNRIRKIVRPFVKKYVYGRKCIAYRHIVRGGV